MPKITFVLIFLLSAVSPAIPSSGAGNSANTLTKWLQQTVYVPLYSHIYGDERFKDKPFLLTATLSIRNTDPEHPLTLHHVNYYDSNGNLLEKYLEHPTIIGPLGSTRYIVKESESKGGSGAKFLVMWNAETAVTEPIIESIMIGTKMQQGISFISRGRVIKGQSTK